MRSASDTASSILCVTMTIARVGMRRAIHKSSRSVRRFSAVVADRARKTARPSSGCRDRARAPRAKPTRWRIPPDSSFGYADSNPSRPMIPIACFARARRSSAATPAARNPSSTLSSTVSHGNSAKLWNTIAMSGVARSPPSRPDESTVPLDGCSSPASRRSSVDFCRSPDGREQRQNLARANLQIAETARARRPARRRAGRNRIVTSLASRRIVGGLASDINQRW